MTPDLTAIKTKHGKSFKVTVYLNGVEYHTLGGARAERANAVVAYVSARDGKATIIGLRADSDAAASEAARLLKPQTPRGYKQSFPPQATWAAAIAIENGVAQ